MTQPKTVMCFGDSNTYGAIPTLARAGRHRFAPDRRWPGIMRRQLGNGWDVIEEGQGGRTTVHDDPIEGIHKNGLKSLPVCLETHMPLDAVVLMLGTNDLKHRFSVTPNDIADSVEILVRIIQRSEAGHAGAAPAVLLVAPPPMLEVDWFGQMFLGGAAKSQHFARLFREVAKRAGVPFVNAGDFVESSTVDGIHLESDAHRVLGLELAKAVQALRG
ncbi:SGNH/GDSL hydrolase family protein [Mesorhizobium sp. IMUNJ 23232]|uniref:SGNH/GDSL hydrolase family protein n=1 Tax=Mesorhizobium sp. IMUNJ 23232 TaxID=3376064 RepID=UPI00378FE907